MTWLYGFISFDRRKRRDGSRNRRFARMRGVEGRSGGASGFQKASASESPRALQQSIRLPRPCGVGHSGLFARRSGSDISRVLWTVAQAEPCGVRITHVSLSNDGGSTSSAPRFSPDRPRLAPWLSRSARLTGAMAPRCPAWPYPKRKRPPVVRKTEWGRREARRRGPLRPSPFVPRSGRLAQAMRGAGLARSAGEFLPHPVEPADRLADLLRADRLLA